MNPVATAIIVLNIALLASARWLELSDAVRIADMDRLKDSDVSFKRNYIRNMTKFAWKSYRDFAWGFDELEPQSHAAHLTSIFGNNLHMGITIIDSLDTLFIMGLEKEYELGKRWVIENIIDRPDLHLDHDASLFELNIRLIGGLLSMHSLTQEQVFLDGALKIANMFLPAFNTPTGLPYSRQDLLGETCNQQYNQQCCQNLADLGTFSLEFQYLSDQTGIPVFGDKIKNVDSVLKKTAGQNDLYPVKINVFNGRPCNNVTTLGGQGDSFYEYLIKYWLYTDKKDSRLLKDYVRSMIAVEKNLVRVSREGFTYIGELSYGYLDPKMGHLTCFAGGMFALTAMHTAGILSDEERAKYAQLAEEVTRTCHESYAQTATHLGPEVFYFVSETGRPEATGMRASTPSYILRPEVIESYFYLWRMTKNQKYRDWAWDAVEALEKHCKTENGYSGITDVNNLFSAKDDVQQSFFLAETLKYLYLIFCDDDVIPLDKFVFNTEAHPLLINHS